MCNPKIELDGKYIYVEDVYEADMLVEIGTTENIICLLSDTDLASVEVFHYKNSVISELFPYITGSACGFIYEIPIPNTDRYDDALVVSFVGV